MKPGVNELDDFDNILKVLFVTLLKIMRYNNVCAEVVTVPHQRCCF